MNNSEVIINLSKGTYWTEQIIMSDKLNIEDAYQRTYSEPRVKAMLKKFDPLRVNMPKVAKREDGTFWVIDGQHTVRLLVMYNYNNVTPIRCLVKSNIDVVKEAELFASQMDGVKKISVCEKFKAQLTAHDADAIALNNATIDCGLSISTTSAPKNNSIACVQTIKSMYAKYGEQSYKEALNILASAYGGAKDSLSGEMISGLVCFCNKYHGRYDKPRLLTVLRGSQANIIVNQAKSEFSTTSGEKRYARKILNLYNYRKQKALEDIL